MTYIFTNIIPRAFAGVGGEGRTKPAPFVSIKSLKCVCSLFQNLPTSAVSGTMLFPSRLLDLPPQTLYDPHDLLDVLPNTFDLCF